MLNVTNRLSQQFGTYSLTMLKQRAIKQILMKTNF